MLNKWYVCKFFFWLFYFFFSFGYNFYGGVRGERRCGYFFDGVGKVLVYVFFLEDGCVYFDEVEIYIDGMLRGINLLWVVIYEFGYVFGFDYFEVCDVIMYLYYIGYVVNMWFYFDDIVGI